jgi:amidase
MSQGARKFLELILAGVPELELAGYMRGLASRSTYARQWNQFFDNFDLVLGPVSTLPPFEVGFDLLGIENALQIAEALALTVTCNLLGLPAVVVPVGSAAGLPQVVQIIGGPRQEIACLRAAQVLETTFGPFDPIVPLFQSDGLGTNSL